MPNGDITSIIQAIGGVEEKIAIQLIMGYLEAQVPFFDLPIINQITEFTITEFLNLVVTKLELLEIDLVTVIETAGQESDFMKAAQANVTAQQSGDQNAIAQAQANLIASARSFFKLTPV